MRTFAKSRIRYSKTQRIGIFAFIIIVFGFQLFSFLSNKVEPEYEVEEIPEKVLVLDQQLENFENEAGEMGNSIEKFDPNKLSEEGWRGLGFSEKQVKTILKYKYSLGGHFSSKDQLKNCFVISEKKFAEIEPYIVVGKLEQKSFDHLDFYSRKNSPSKFRYEKFNPNEYSQEDWQRIGFSEKQAATILKYKKLKGGKFISLEQIRNCYVISEEKFKEMKSYMILPVVKSKGEIRLLDVSTDSAQTKTSSQLEKFTPNNLTFQEWVNLGFTEKQAQTILNYKKSLGGKFKDAETFKKCYAVSEGKFKELEPYLVFDE